MQATNLCWLGQQLRYSEHVPFYSFACCLPVAHHQMWAAINAMFILLLATCILMAADAGGCQLLQYGCQADQTKAAAAAAATKFSKAATARHISASAGGSGCGKRQRKGRCRSQRSMIQQFGQVLCGCGLALLAVVSGSTPCSPWCCSCAGAAVLQQHATTASMSSTMLHRLPGVLNTGNTIKLTANCY